MVMTIKRSLPPEGMGEACTASSEFHPSLRDLQVILATIDFEHESDIETVKQSSIDDWIKHTVIAKLQEHHREQRTRYLRQLSALHKRIKLIAA